MTARERWRASNATEIHSDEAPITSKIEQQLAQLVRQFGSEKVRDALAPLVTKCKWEISIDENVSLFADPGAVIPT